MQQVLTLMALGHPSVAFIFRHNDREVWRLPTKPARAPRLCNAD